MQNAHQPHLKMVYFLKPLTPAILRPRQPSGNDSGSCANAGTRRKGNSGSYRSGSDADCRECLPRSDSGSVTTTAAPFSRGSGDRRPAHDGSRGYRNANDPQAPAGATDPLRPRPDASRDLTLRTFRCPPILSRTRLGTLPRRAFQAGRLFGECLPTNLTSPPIPIRGVWRRRQKMKEASPRWARLPEKSTNSNDRRDAARVRQPVPGGGYPPGA